MEALVLAAVAALATQPASARHRGRPLEQVLDELRARGLNVIYSSAVVTPEMVVEREPKAADPRRALDDVLAPLGLRAKDDPSGAILIVRSTEPAPSVAAEEPSSKKKPESRWVEDVVVTPGAREIVPRDVSAPRSLDAQDLSAAPTLASDPVRAATLLPGVAGSDASAAFYPRGSDGRGVALILDGFELDDPYHLDGFLRPFSVIDGGSIGSMSVTTGGYTADRGDRDGGFVEMETSAAPAEPTTDVELGTLNSRLAFAMPTGLGPLLVAGRYWYPEASADTIAFASDGLKPAMGDLYVKAGLLETASTVLSAHALLAADKATLNEPDTPERVDAQSRSGALWLRALHVWSSGVTTEAVISVGESSGVRAGTADAAGVAIAVDDERDVRYAGLRTDVTWTIDRESALRGGFEGRLQGAEMAYSSAPAGAPTNAIEVDRAGTSLAAYAAYRRTLARGLTAEAGLR